MFEDLLAIVIVSNLTYSESRTDLFCTASVFYSQNITKCRTLLNVDRLKIGLIRFVRLFCFTHKRFTKCPTLLNVAGAEVKM